MSQVKYEAIQTRYKGYNFRSRLEARYAVMFDFLGIDWIYEEEGYDLGPLGWYLPDFWIPYSRSDSRGIGVWVEIKGTYPTELEIKKCVALRLIRRMGMYILYGPIDLDAHNCINPFPDDDRQKRDECALSTACFLDARWWDMYRENIPRGVAEDAVYAARSARFEFGESGAT